MEILSEKFENIGYKYDYQMAMLTIFDNDKVVAQLHFEFDERFKAKTLQYFGDMLYETISNKLEFINAASDMLLEVGTYEYDEKKMWGSWYANN